MLFVLALILLPVPVYVTVQGIVGMITGSTPESRRAKRDAAWRQRWR